MTWGSSSSPVARRRSGTRSATSSSRSVWAAPRRRRTPSSWHGALVPQRGVTQDFLSGLYRGVARAGVPAVGVQLSASENAAVPAFARNGLSTVDGVDTAAGKLALVLLALGCARRRLRRRRDRLGRDPASRHTPARGVRAELTVLVAARDEEGRIGDTIARLREAFPEAEVVVADDGSRDATAAVAERAGARVVRLPRRGKGQALTLAERELATGPLLLCDADLEGDLRPLARSGADVAVARVREASRRRLRDREANGPRARPPARRLSRGGAAVRPAPVVGAGEKGLLPRCRRLRRRDPDDDRRSPRGSQRRGSRARARPPRHRARREGLPAPGAPAARRRCSPASRRPSTSGASGCRSSARSSASRSRPSRPSRPSGSPTISGAAPSAASGPTSAPAPRRGR